MSNKITPDSNDKGATRSYTLGHIASTLAAKEREEEDKKVVKIHNDHRFDFDNSTDTNSTIEKFF